MKYIIVHEADYSEHRIFLSHIVAVKDRINSTSMRSEILVSAGEWIGLRETVDEVLSKISKELE